MSEQTKCKNNAPKEVIFDPSSSTTQIQRAINHQHNGGRIQNVHTLLDHFGTGNVEEGP